MGLGLSSHSDPRPESGIGEAGARAELSLKLAQRALATGPGETPGIGKGAWGQGARLCLFPFQKISVGGERREKNVCLLI